MSETQRRFLPIAAVAAAVLAISSCGEKSAGDGPYAGLVAEFEPQIERELGLPFKTPPKIEVRTPQEVAEFVGRQLDSERGREQVAGQEAVYRILGIIPDTLQLKPLLQRLLEEQIAGYYDPKTKVLYVVDGAKPELLRQTVAHELVHALQDQYLNIDSIQASTTDADRQTAAQAVLEGQAVFMQLRVEPSTASIIKMPGGWDRIRELIRDGSVGMPVFASAPRAIREGLLFPYLGGADFVRRFILKRPEKELLTDLPVSTRQILSDAAYFAASPAERVVPVSVSIPAARVGTAVFSNTLGEFDTRLVLGQRISDDALVRRAAGGLAGDRFTLFKSADGESLVWATVWDSPVDAADFLDAASESARKRYDLGVPREPARGTLRRFDISAAAGRSARIVTVQLEQIDGHPVVIYMDYPARQAAPINPLQVAVGS